MMDYPEYKDIIGAVQKLKLIGALLTTVQVKINSYYYVKSTEAVPVCTLY